MPSSAFNAARPSPMHRIVFRQGMRTRRVRTTKMDTHEGCPFSLWSMVRSYEGWKDRFDRTIALGRIKKLMEWPSEGDIRRKRLLRRADDIESCISAVTGKQISAFG